MAERTIKWFPVWIDETGYQIRFLSTEAKGAYLALALEYFEKEQLPDKDETIRKISGMDGKRWPKIRDELKEHVFTGDWRNLKWEERLGKIRGTSSQRSGAARTRWNQAKPDTDVRPISDGWEHSEIDSGDWIPEAA
jgi:uncharacterized protein YdaU (DUF1376 family)